MSIVSILSYICIYFHNANVNISYKDFILFNCLFPIKQRWLSTDFKNKSNIKYLTNMVYAWTRSRMHQNDYFSLVDKKISRRYLAWFHPWLNKKNIIKTMKSEKNSLKNNSSFFF